MAGGFFVFGPVLKTEVQPFRPNFHLPDRLQEETVLLQASLRGVVKTEIDLAFAAVDGVSYVFHMIHISK